MAVDAKASIGPQPSGTPSTPDLSANPLNPPPAWFPADAAKAMEPLLAPVRAVAKYKARSHNTSKNVHIPLLESHTLACPDRGPTIVLLGDSMFERMLTTGQSPNFPSAPWPSLTLLPDATEETKHLRECPNPERLDRVFNAGVGGDRIQNLAYRLVGDSERGLPGLLPLLAWCGTVRLWVIHMGTNNLSPKRGLSSADEHALWVLLETLLNVNARGLRCEVLLTGLFERTDVPRSIVEQVNETIKGVGRLADKRYGIGRVAYWEPPLRFDKETHLDDHVHLNLEGYRVWADWLLVILRRMIKSLEEREQDYRKQGGLPSHYKTWFGPQLADWTFVSRR